MAKVMITIADLIKMLPENTMLVVELEEEGDEDDSEE